MNIKTIIFSIFLALSSPVALAGTGHSHAPVTQEQAEVNASKVVSTLVQRGVIDKSWGEIQIQQSEQKQFGNQTEWVVSYTNESVSDPGKRTLYIFLTLSGEYLAANYTGK